MSKTGFHERLKTSRIVMNLSLAEFAVLGGVQARTQIYYERGERSPTVEYIFKLERSGVDIHYLIFGSTLDVKKIPKMTSDLLMAYENASEEKKNAIEYVAGIK